MRRWTITIALVYAGAVLSAAATAPAALAAGAGNSILAECSTGHVSPAYSVQQLRHALASMSASEKQYTSCVDVIQSAIIKAQRNRTGSAGSSSGGSFLPTPVIIILAVLVAAALGFAGLALARRRRPSGSGP
ncbi:MAG TPA: hypothetical protein VG365_07950 [Solirubrobacteraceae bacterium]|jgi:hypothetical protein|nr:hypothetical protein [Solirubrobacteraceae bacterium]